jgi:hypothetical protein
MIFLSALAAAVLGLGLWVMARQVRRRNLDRWLVPYVLQTARRRARRRGEPVHLLLCIGDHYEPGNGGVSAEVARARVARWRRDYPRLFHRFRDRDGRPPQHTFFYPLEQYDREHLDALTELCRAGYGEVEVHLHHDGACAEDLRRQLLDYKELLAQRHGLLARHRHTGEVRYAFIHGNWALDNSRPDGRCCGVNNELDVLRETGCYVDMTLPSAPSPTQTRTINSIYYATDDPARPKSHDRGVPVGRAPQPPNSLMLIQGPLLLDWGNRKWGLAPRIENACIHETLPPTLPRAWLWLKARVQVPARPDWFFVKLHTHGAREPNAEVLLGDAAVRFHEALARQAEADPDFHYHYVTAREMYNLAKAAEAGWTGSVDAARDYLLVRNTPRAEWEEGLPTAGRESCLTGRS